MSVVTLEGKREIVALLEERERRVRTNRLERYIPYPKQAEFHAVGLNCRERLMMAANQCISPWTFIETDQSTARVAEMLTSPRGRVRSLVDGREGIAHRRGWFLRGIEPAFRVVLDSGRWFDCTAEHRVRTGDGWTSLAQLVLRTGGLRYWHTHADWSASCVVDDYLHGRALLSAASTGGDGLHRQPDVLGHSHSWTLADAKGRTPEHIHACLDGDLQSIAECAGSQLSGLFEQFAGPAGAPPVLPLLGDIQVQRRLALESCGGFQSSSEGGLHQDNHQGQRGQGECRDGVDRLAPSPLLNLGELPFPDVQCLGHSMRSALLDADRAAIFFPFGNITLVGGAAIIAMVPIGYQPIMDVQVEGSNNYKSAGVFHHNCGKTLAGGYEVAMHLTGRYPDWWQGRRFDKPVVWWVASETMEVSRDGAQRVLLGRGENRGEGAIPGDCIKTISRYPNVVDAVSQVTVNHVSGGTSLVIFKSYDQGRRKFQGDTINGIWFDEEPPEQIYTEGLTRTNAAFGPVMMTFTPLLGMSSVVLRFLQPAEDDAGAKDRAIVSMTIDDVEHYTPEARAAIIASYPDYEREARTKGIPIMGSGRVFPIAEERILYDPSVVKLEPHWPRIAGIDFGWDHPTAGAWLAWDRDGDVVYVYDDYSQSEQTPIIHAAAFRAKGADIPVAWPHDGLQHDKGSGEQLAAQYRAQNLAMLPSRAKFPDGSNGVEAGIMAILDRMQTGRFKVSRSCQNWWREFRMYHRKDGLIVKLNDDVISASRYALMCLAQAKVTGRSVSAIKFRSAFG